MNFNEVKKQFKVAIGHFSTFIQNPWYQIKHLKHISPEALTYYIITLSVVPVVLNIVFHFGFWGFLSIITIPFRSLITVSLWLMIGYIVHMIVFRQKEYDVLLVANLATFSSSFWILTQTIPFLNALAGVFSLVLFCEAYSEKIQEPKPRVYLAFSIALLICIIPILVAFRSH